MNIIPELQPTPGMSSEDKVWTMDNKKCIGPNGVLMNNFFEKIESILDKISPRESIILAGDLNINGLHNNNPTNNFKDIMTSYSLSSHITLPTRLNSTGQNGTQIDHIWSNIDRVPVSGVFNSIFTTDHFPNFIIFPSTLEKSNVKITFRDHSETCHGNLIDEINPFASTFSASTYCALTTSQ